MPLEPLELASRPALHDQRDVQADSKGEQECDANRHRQQWRLISQHHPDRRTYRQGELGYQRESEGCPKHLLLIRNRFSGGMGTRPFRPAETALSWGRACHRVGDEGKDESKRPLRADQVCPQGT